MRIVAALAAVVEASIVGCVSPPPTAEPPAEPADAVRDESPSPPPVAPVESAETTPDAGDRKFRPGIVPRDLRERGPATIRLRLQPIDGEPNRFVSGRLWRLRVPASNGWTAGDEVVMPSKEDLPAYVFHELPFGAYRFEVRNKRHGGVDPPEFTIDGVTNEITVPVDDRRTIPVYLAVYASDGSLYDTCSVLNNGGWAHMFGKRRAEYPEWATPRVPEDPSWVEHSVSSGTMVGHAYPDKTPRDCLAESDGRFRVGEVTEEHWAGDESMRSWSVSVGTGMDVGVSLRWGVSLRYGDVKRTDFVGVAPRETEVRECIVDEESRNLIFAENARLELSCQAVLRRDDPRQWESIPVHVKVVRDGYETLEFTWRVATRDVKHPMRKLQR
jgi:hypothetical protein